MWRVHEAKRRAVIRAAGCRRRVGRGVALTFDDGPDPTYTPLLLDALAREQAVATFFLVGDAAERHPDLVRRMVADGHAVGSHTRSHPDCSTLDVDAIRTEIREGREQVADAGGRATDLFRPCQGHLDWNVFRAMRAEAVRPWLWSASPEDWQPGTSVDDILVSLAGVRDGDVVLLHDAIELPESPEARDRSATIDAVPALVAQLRARGLALTTLV